MLPGLIGCALNVARSLAARDVQTGHNDERQVGKGEEQHRRENALTRVLH